MCVKRLVVREVVVVVVVGRKGKMASELAVTPPLLVPGKASDLLRGVDVLLRNFLQSLIGGAKAVERREGFAPNKKMTSFGPTCQSETAKPFVSTGVCCVCMCVCVSSGCLHMTGKGRKEGL